MTQPRGQTTRPRGVDGLLFAQVLDGTGNATYVGWPEVRAWTSGGATMWVHLDRHGEGSRRWLERESGLEDVVVEELLANFTRIWRLSPAGSLLQPERNCFDQERIASCSRQQLVRKRLQD